MGLGNQKAIVCSREEDVPEDYLLDRLTASWREALALTRSDHRAGDHIYQTGDHVPWIYLCESGSSGLISVRRTMSDGTVHELLTIGGPVTLLVGSHTIGMGRAQYDALVRLDWHGWRASHERFQALRGKDQDFDRFIIRAFEVMQSTLAEVAGCQRDHKIEQQVCRVLLFVRAALGTDVIPLGLPVIVDMVSRKSAYNAARKLAVDGVINYHDGEVRIADPAWLAERACPCFETLMQERKERIFRRA